MDEATLEYYEQNAATVAPGYEAVSAGVSALFPFVFKRGQRVLDIGAGSGRDMARLLSLGMDAYGIEPSESMRNAAVAAHPDLSARLFAGNVPGGLPSTLPGPWDAIMLSAVIMHIPDAELFDVALELREQLAVGGKLLVSAPETRPDVSPGASRDNRGRLMIVRSPTQLRLLFERLGFELENQWTSADSTGRPFLWTTLLFRRAAGTPGAGGLGRVASIINADRKVATYKLALIRALCDIAMTSWALASWEAGGVVSVPLALVAERWVRYYWPLMGPGPRSRDADEPSVRFPQINGEGKGAKPIAFRAVLSELVDECRPLGGLTAKRCTRVPPRTPPQGVVPSPAPGQSQAAL
jgi:SAM-dependent methyltransferase